MWRTRYMQEQRDPSGCSRSLVRYGPERAGGDKARVAGTMGRFAGENTPKCTSWYLEAQQCIFCCGLICKSLACGLTRGRGNEANETLAYCRMRGALVCFHTKAEKEESNSHGEEMTLTSETGKERQRHSKGSWASHQGYGSDEEISIIRDSPEVNKPMSVLCSSNMHLAPIHPLQGISIHE